MDTAGYTLDYQENVWTQQRNSLFIDSYSQIQNLTNDHAVWSYSNFSPGCVMDFYFINPNNTKVTHYSIHYFGGN